jgi:hypothetical protein
VHCYESVADYLPLGEPGHSPDTAGCINILTPKRFVTPTSTGMASNSCLIQVEKWQRVTRADRDGTLHSAHRVLTDNALLGGIAP